MNAGAVKVGFAMAGIFAAGAVAGGFSGAAYERRQAQQAAERAVRSSAEHVSAQKVIDTRYKVLVKDLQLTAEQEECIKPVMHEYVEELRGARRKAFAEVDLVVKQMNARIESELTPSQLAKFREIQENHRRRYEEEMKRRNLSTDPKAAAEKSLLPPDAVPAAPEKPPAAP